MATHQSHDDQQPASRSVTSSPTLTPGQVYGDARHTTGDPDSATTPADAFSVTFELVFVDDDRVLLRARSGSDYRYERRDEFEAGIGSRWRLLTDPGEAKHTDQTLPDDTHQLEPYLRLLRNRRANHEETNGERGRLLTQGIQQAIIALEHYDPTPCDFEAVDGIGPQTAANLRDAGFVTDADVDVARNDRLLNVDGIGEQTLANLTAFVANP